MPTEDMSRSRVASDQHLMPPAGPRHRLDAARSALVVVDMQNDFCADGGYVSRLGRDTGPCREIVPRLSVLVEAARRHDVPVVWLMAEYEDDAITGPMLAKKRQMGIREVCCARGSWGAQPFGVAPGAGEIVVVKHRYSGFAGTNLDERLRTLRTGTLIFCGVQTNLCVESTLRDAHSHGYHVVIAEDCVASHMLKEHDATLTNVRFLFGDVLESPTLIAGWAGQVTA